MSKDKCTSIFLSQMGVIAPSISSKTDVNFMEHMPPDLRRNSHLRHSPPPPLPIEFPFRWPLAIHETLKTVNSFLIVVFLWHVTFLVSSLYLRSWLQSAGRDDF